MLFKLCHHCGINKLQSEFGINRARKDGLSHICKECQKIKNKKNYDKHAEERREYARDYRDDHLEERKAYNRGYYTDHAEILKEYQKDYRATHTIVRSEEAKQRHNEQVKAKYASDPEHRARCLARSKANREQNPERTAAVMKAWVDANREHVNEYQRNYGVDYRKTPQHIAWWANYRIVNRVKIQADNHNYRAMRAGAEGSCPNEHLYHLHKWQDHCCFYCREYLDKQDTVEHVVPLVRGGTNHPHNIVLACGPCNFSKQDRLLTEWQPKHVAEVVRQHSIHWTKELCAAVQAEGVEATVGDGVIHMEGGDILMLSSFWNQEPAPANPNTLVIYDFEWWEDPETVLGAILFGEPMPAVEPGYVGPDGYTTGVDIECPEAHGLFFIEGLPERVLKLTAAEMLLAA